jgi:hypothetical protein
MAMGNICSGRRGWHGGKLPTAALPAVRLTFGALWSPHGRCRPTIDFHYKDGTATIGWLGQEWLVRVHETALHLGGTRRWLGCPDCGVRRPALYVRGDRLACRACLRLRHESQHESQRQRAHRRADAPRARLGWQPGLVNSYGARPRGMRTATYLRIARELVRIEGALLGDYWRRVEALEGRE